MTKVQKLLKDITKLVSEAVEERDAQGAAITSIATGLGSTFFGSAASPRFGIDPNNVPVGIGEPLDFAPAPETLQHDLVFYLLTTSEAAFVESMQKLHKLRDSGLARFAVERGFQRKNRRELFGFRDGLRNPDRHDRTKIAFIDRGTAPHEPAWTGGGSYLVYLKIKQNFDSFDGLSEPQQEDVLGRKLDETGTRLDKALGHGSTY